MKSKSKYEVLSVASVASTNEYTAKRKKSLLCGVVVDVALS